MYFFSSIGQSIVVDSNVVTDTHGHWLVVDERDVSIDDGRHREKNQSSLC